MIPNPKCIEASGCGEWTRPEIANPAYKGKWFAPLIDNPEYIGVWAAKKIAWVSLSYSLLGLTED